MIGPLFLFAASPIVASSDVQVKKLEEGRYRLTVNRFKGVDYQFAQAAVRPTAERLCSPIAPQYDKFRLKAQLTSKAGNRIRPGQFEQDISCVATQQETTSASGVGFAPDKNDDLAARAAALAYYRVKDSGDVEGTLARLSDGQRAIVNKKEWQAEIRNSPKRLGRDIRRRVVKLTWYANPEGVPRGVYVAVDMAGESENMAAICGYVAMRRLATDRFEVVRDDAGLLDRKSATTATTDQMAQFRSQLGCVSE